MAERLKVAEDLQDWLAAHRGATALRAQRLEEGRADLVAELDVALGQITEQCERLLQLAAACGEAGHTCTH